MMVFLIKFGSRFEGKRWAPFHEYYRFDRRCRFVFRDIAKGVKYTMRLSNSKDFFVPRIPLTGFREGA